MGQVLTLLDSPDAASLPDRLRPLTETLRALRLPVEAATDPAALRNAVEAVAGLLVPRGAQPGTATRGPADGLRNLFLTLAGLVADDQMSASTPSAAKPGGSATPRPDPQATGERLTPGEATQLARSTGEQAQTQGTLARLARALDDTLLQDIVRQQGGGRAAGSAESAPLPQPAGKGADLTLNVPLLVGGETRLLSLAIGREGGGQGGSAAGPAEWRLRFALALPSTGPVEAAVSLRGRSIAVVLRAEQPETVTALQGLQETLSALMAEEGLDLAGLQILKAPSSRGQLADTLS
ncbi:flagellar hook-length control protein FliK [Pannonibacter sp. SL95]|uniref:flagellar hook-length control protein FliK n=1 Tax=Pannonibacter sp. SL95 TaxID=2995153 RepID=UPI002275120E|nr:flagellar hook-length control protein FliK [Pannonibacter sp. SL95]MCY1706011.1 flagellar hook-length control protein FliK [Pannonibacter sp. SL95]